MTTENYRYRTSPLFLRNQFLGENQWKIPNVPKCTLTAEELDGLRLIGYDRAKNGNDEHFQRMVHFFLYDHKFEDIWEDPEKRVDVLKKYRAVLTPDFSMYLEMHPMLQLYNTFRNRWVGAYLAEQGITVVPTANWGDEPTFEFCFEGIAKGSAVAVSTYMATEHDNRKDQKEWFLKGYNEMLRRIEPEVIICYHPPFPEMQGNIVYVDYDLSSWKHDEDDLEKVRSAASQKGIRIVKRTGYVVFDKGGGSAYGGEWRPSKAEDERFLGKPGDIKTTEMPGGSKYQDIIGKDGRAVYERHWTNHGNSAKHTIPNDHFIYWDNPTGHPDPGPPINYPNGDYPDIFSPEWLAEYFTWKQVKSMNETIIIPPGSINFKTISEFKWSIHYGAEIGFTWNGHNYHICSKVPPSPGADPMILFYEDYKEETEQWFQTPDEVIDVIIDGMKLRKIITQLEVTERTI